MTTTREQLLTELEALRNRVEQITRELARLDASPTPPPARRHLRVIH